MVCMTHKWWKINKLRVIIVGLYSKWKIQITREINK